MEARNWEHLPSMCLPMIFQRVGFAALANNIPLVCKSWYKALRGPGSWKHIDFSDVEASSDQIKYAVSLSLGAAVEFKFPNSCSVKDLAYVSKRCPLLKHVKLPNVVCGPCKCKEVWRPVGKWKDLEHLELHTELWFRDMIMVVGRRCKNLKKLTISGNLGNSQGSLIFTWASMIKYLRVTEGSIVEWDSLYGIIKKCIEFEEVDVRNCVGCQTYYRRSDLLQRGSHLKIFKAGGCTNLF